MHHQPNQLTKSYSTSSANGSHFPSDRIHRSARLPLNRARTASTYISRPCIGRRIAAIIASLSTCRLPEQCLHCKVRIVLSKTSRPIKFTNHFTYVSPTGSCQFVVGMYVAFRTALLPMKLEQTVVSVRCGRCGVSSLSQMRTHNIGAARISLPEMCQYVRHEARYICARNCIRACVYQCSVPLHVPPLMLRLLIAS